MTYLPPKFSVFQTDLIQNNTECLSIVNVDGSAHIFQLNTLNHACTLDKAESVDLQEMWRQIQLSDESS
jgi:hypothetical protein